MHLTFRLQLKAYWLGFFAWLILTCAPIASALTQSDVGYLRLCSALGAHWVQVTPEDINVDQTVCTCLNLGLTSTAPAVADQNYHAFIVLNQAVVSLPLETSLSSQPRAPPSLFS